MSVIFFQETNLYNTFATVYCDGENKGWRYLVPLHRSASTSDADDDRPLGLPQLACRALWPQKTFFPDGSYWC